MTHKSRNEKSIFMTAIEIPSQSQRAAYLDEACGEDRALRCKVEGLLREHAKRQHLLDVAEAVAVPEVGEAEGPGTSIGPYKLREQIGEGGFGVVYVAEQEEPVRRKVALKIIKPGMDTRNVIARFEAERQALAIMDHPHVARVFDAGATQSGRPYFVMELVHGLPLTEFCDEQRLTTRDRLRLLLDVCSAVQHAHQKGIIHRDLKPTNIIVSLHGDKPVPKVIDFGVSKALHQRLTEKTIYTAYGQLIGTPTYMSPEQAHLSGLDVDTRSDVYSLGVLLYELLTGTTPFDEQLLKSAGFDEMRRIIREDDPPRPSVRVSTLKADRLSTISAERRIDPGKFSGVLRGELDWIVMKALEKDRDRRYESVSALAADVQRYLRDEPVTACPPSRVYRLRKFGRRNSMAIVTTCLVGLSLVAGLVATTWQTRRALRSEKVASDRLAEKEQAEQERSRQLALARVSEARALRWSGRQGQRFESLAALRESADILHSLGELDEHLLELRNEAIACMPLVDVRERRRWNPEVLPPYKGQYELTFAPQYDRYYLEDRQTGKKAIYRLADDKELMSLPKDVHACWFSPDGRFLFGVHAGSPPVFTVRDTTTGKILLRAPRSHYFVADFTRDSRRVAVGCSGHRISFFDLPSGNKCNEIALGREPTFLRFHPDKTRVAVAVMDEEDRETREVQIWSVEEEQMLKSLKHPGYVSGYESSLTWSAHGDLLAVASYDGCIHVWDAQTYEERAVLKGHQGEVVRVLFSNHDYLLASSGWDGTLRFWEPRDGRQLLRVKGGFFKNRFSADDRLLSWGPQLWEVAPGRELRRLHVNMGAAGCLHFSPDGRLLICCGDENEGVEFWDVASGLRVGRIPIGVCDWAILDETGTHLFTNGERGIHRWPVEVDATAESLRIGPPQQLDASVQAEWGGRALSSSAKALAAVTGTREAVVLFPEHSRDTVRLVGHDKISSIAIHPSVRWVASAARRHGPGGIILWNAETGERIDDLFPNSGESAVAFTPDGRRLVAGTPNEYQFWDVGTWERSLRISRQGPNDLRGPIAFTKDGSVMAIAKTRYLVQLVDAATGQEIATLDSGTPVTVCGLCFSPNEGLLAVAHWGDLIHLWDLGSIRRQLREMGLDWEPPLAPPAAGSDQPSPRWNVEIDLGELGETEREEH